MAKVSVSSSRWQIPPDVSVACIYVCPGPCPLFFRHAKEGSFCSLLKTSFGVRPIATNKRNLRGFLSARLSACRWGGSTLISGAEWAATTS